MPTPMAAPIIPIPPPRSRSDVLSPMYAIAVGRVAEERILARTRAAISIHNSIEKPNSNCAKALPNTPIIKTGLRPIRSDTPPQIGEKMNCKITAVFLHC